MNRCTKACAGQLQGPRLTIDGQKRWISYDRSKQSQGQVLKQIQAEITRIKTCTNQIDPKKKTIKTESGELPISPVLDPEWSAKRRRTRKPEAGKMSGQFRRHLSNNPYAEALMTPMRWCKNTNAILPKYFLQDFDLVKHPNPEQKEVWYAPGPQSFVNVMPWNAPRPVEQDETNTNTQKDETPDMTSQTKVSAKRGGFIEDKETEEVENARPEELEEDGESTEDWREDSHRAGRYVTYALSRKSLIEQIGRSKSLQIRMRAQRNGMATRGLPEQRIFRPDMDEVLLKMMQRQAADALIARSYSNRDSKKDPHKFIIPVDSWEEAQKYVAGGAILYIPTEPSDDMNNYATLDVEGANYGAKVAVHDLNFLLGDEVERLKQESEDFVGQELLILKNYRSESMRSLFLLLWRLQGYLAEPQIELIEPRQY
ncbi:uncharacterized protein B0J16DRAFT_367568 [Fusarium flagelliforme]|uniref:uncharacterized protein n=1 Tax=Fusarium flagelliforme TaxID=2675880 RepID=UPI001E8E168B|nr:uncharacterized protein B0J16DRAFT_367568 [Fusarium flagelliforme]KAH7198497.1 hypothetical protein B0J16DRAFT_367568 [Fusarium flagelliforme]